MRHIESENRAPPCERVCFHVEWWRGITRRRLAVLLTVACPDLHRCAWCRATGETGLCVLDGRRRRRGDAAATPSDCSTSSAAARAPTSRRRRPLQGRARGAASAGSAGGAGVAPAARPRHHRRGPSASSTAARGSMCRRERCATVSSFYFTPCPPWWSAGEPAAGQGRRECEPLLARAAELRRHREHPHDARVGRRARRGSRSLAARCLFLLLLRRSTPRHCDRKKKCCNVA